MDTKLDSNDFSGFDEQKHLINDDPIIEREEKSDNGYSIRNLLGIVFTFLSFGFLPIIANLIAILLCISALKTDTDSNARLIMKICIFMNIVIMLSLGAILYFVAIPSMMETYGGIPLPL